MIQNFTRNMNNNNNYFGNNINNNNNYNKINNNNSNMKKSNSRQQSFHNRSFDIEKKDFPSKQFSTTELTNKYGDKLIGMMTDKEKNWVVNVQMLQLQIDDPYCYDFYYTVRNGIFLYLFYYMVKQWFLVTWSKTRVIRKMAI